MARKKKADGRRLRTKSLTFRLDPIIQHLAIVASRKERRPLTSLIESGLKERLRNVASGGVSMSFLDPEVIDQLWNEHEADRLVQLALFDMTLLSYLDRLQYSIQSRRLGWWCSKPDCV